MKLLVDNSCHFEPHKFYMRTYSNHGINTGSPKLTSFTAKIRATRQVFPLRDRKPFYPKSARWHPSSHPRNPIDSVTLVTELGTRTSGKGRICTLRNTQPHSLTENLPPNEIGKYIDTNKSLQSP